MTFSAAVFTRLLADAQIAAVVPGGWYPLRLPAECALPAGVYQRISDPVSYTHSGPTALRDRRYQLDIYAERYAQADDAMAVVLASISGTADEWSGYTVVAQVVDAGESIDPAPRGLFRQRLDLMLTSDAP